MFRTGDDLSSPWMQMDEVSSEDRPAARIAFVKQVQPSSLHRLEVGLHPKYAYEWDRTQAYKQACLEAKTNASRGIEQTIVYEPWAVRGELDILTETLEAKCFEFSLNSVASGRKEHYKWENCFVQGIKGLEDDHGRRLVRTRTGEVIAGWTRPKNYKHNRGHIGRMVFSGPSKYIGGDLTLMAIISMLVGMRATYDFCGTRCGPEGTCLEPLPPIPVAPIRLPSFHAPQYQRPLEKSEQRRQQAVEMGITLGHTMRKVFDARK